MSKIQRPSMVSRWSGEYRYRLFGPDGNVKQERDWQPNLILDQGLQKVITSGIQSYLAIGTSNAAVDVTQVGLQGATLACDNTLTLVDRNDPVGPNWERTQTVQAVYGTGVGTGTIEEFILTTEWNNTSNVEASIRALLDAPIVKGPLDQLTFQHRITFWPVTTDVDSVINISGVAYNCKMRQFYGVNNQNGMSNTSWDGVQNLYYNATIPADLDVVNMPGSHAGAASQVITTPGGSAPNFWEDIEIVWGIDSANQLNCNMVQLNTENAQPKIAARLTKVSDGTGIDKFNTHELRLYFRLYTARYP